MSAGLWEDPDPPSDGCESRVASTSVDVVHISDDGKARILSY